MAGKDDRDLRIVSGRTALHRGRIKVNDGLLIRLELGGHQLPNGTKLRSTSAPAFLCLYMGGFPAGRVPFPASRRPAPAPSFRL